MTTGRNCTLRHGCWLILWYLDVCFETTSCQRKKCGISKRVTVVCECSQKIFTILSKCEMFWLCFEFWRFLSPGKAGDKVRKKQKKIGKKKTETNMGLPIKNQNRKNSTNGRPWVWWHRPHCLGDTSSSPMSHRTAGLNKNPPSCDGVFVYFCITTKQNQSKYSLHMFTLKQHKS